MLAQALTTSLLFAAAIAQPTDLKARQYGGGALSCTDTSSYELSEPPTTVEGDVVVATGQTCTSTTNDPCTVGANWSKSFGITTTVGGGFDVDEIFSLDASVSYTTTTTTGFSIGEPCPKGGYVCGLTYQLNQAHVKGKENYYYAACGAINGELEKSEDFEFTAPVMVGDGPQVTYAACIAENSPNQDTDSVGVPLCPGTF
ncbi:MAG: hypothetical protein M4579_004174 [Chaenotheca gracillima]|nr:MAG: hypothetical protein M4579_004174 [Chaenotheca gracillima]